MVLFDRNLLEEMRGAIPKRAGVCWRCAAAIGKAPRWDHYQRWSGVRTHVGRTRREGARSANLSWSLGAVKNRDLLAFLAEDLCCGKTLDDAHRSLAARTTPEFWIACNSRRRNSRHRCE